MSNILVIGGAGYIGAHMVKMLRRQGRQVLVLDNLSTGHKESVAAAGAELVEGEAGDVALVAGLLQEREITAVMHFAACSIVSESVRNPDKYYANNVEQTAALLATLTDKNPAIPFIFSSTAAVYGHPQALPINENHLLQPVNPYGDSKRMAEEIIVKSGINYGILRYFNAAGADPEGELGENHDPETHLIPLVLQAASGKRADIAIYGTDYDTPDGTCIRDYIHVVDLCRAHLLLLDYLADNGANSDCQRLFNLGTGSGYSVREVIDTVRRVTGRDIKVRAEGRREGDPPVLIADGTKAREILDWQPQHSELTAIIADAWRWQQRS